MGYNAAGKSTLVKEYESQGYARLNRDIIGGKLSDLAKKIPEFMNNKGVILDNTYADVESRKSILDIGKQLKIPVHCFLLNTSFEDAQYNACKRMVNDLGRLLSPEEMKKTNNPNHFPPAALFNYRSRFVKPTTAEGFASVKSIPFERKDDPSYTTKALILDYDQTLRNSTGEKDYPIKPEEVVILPGRTEKIKEYIKKGWKIFGVSNQSGVAKKILTEDQAKKCFEHTNKLLGIDIEFYFCPHNIPPVVCYCRKPHCGIGVFLIEKYKLDRKNCIFVGDQTTDKTFAQRCGFQYIDQGDFFQ
jgi:HAD superfamily hydrolase (TIGR01662 family)